MQIRLAVVLYSIQVASKKGSIVHMCVVICRLLVFFIIVCRGVVGRERVGTEFIGGSRMCSRGGSSTSSSGCILTAK